MPTTTGRSFSVSPLTIAVGKNPCSSPEVLELQDRTSIESSKIPKRPISDCVSNLAISLWTKFELDGENVRT
jgi:hypothetical protein